jgi:hypothetical protein
MPLQGGVWFCDWGGLSGLGGVGGLQFPSRSATSAHSSSKSWGPGLMIISVRRMKAVHDSVEGCSLASLFAGIGTRLFTGGGENGAVAGAGAGAGAGTGASAAGAPVLPT